VRLGGSQRTTATLRKLSGGNAGTAETLRYMRDLVRQSLINPAQTVREKALSLVSALPARQWLGEIRVLHEFVRDEIRYVNDPEEFELVQTPEKTLEYGQGDCDDQATLLAGLLHSLGHPAQFTAVGLGGGPFSHVLVETKVGERWVPLETIIQKPLGWYPPDATSRYTLKV